MATGKPRTGAAVEARTGIIDIGSNSIRLVVYQGPERLPSVLFNEKVMAGLGRDLAATGAIGDDALASADAALGRFAAVAREMALTRLRTVATAAVREASNGQTLLDMAAAHGLEVELLSGEQEALAAGHGVISAIPEADGIVVSGLVRELCDVETDRFLPLGERRLKGFPDKTPVFRFEWRC